MSTKTKKIIKKRVKRKLHPNFGLRLGKSKLEGLGVFADRDFDKDEVVEICPYLLIHKDEMDDDCSVCDYTFEFDDDTEVLMLGYGSMYNHHQNNNLEYVYDEDKDLFEYVTLRPVQKGEELTVNYGEEYWEARGIKPKQ